MRNLFNGQCDHCLTFKPRCVRVLILVGDVNPGAPAAEREKRVGMIVCEKCRKELRGKYRLAEEHRKK